MFTAAIFLPLLGAAIAGLFGRVIGDRAAMWVTCTLMAVSAALSIFIFQDVAIAGHERTVELFTWIQSGALSVSWSLGFDTLSAVMVLVVSLVSAVIHVYSVGYMHHDPHRARFFAYISLFTFAMLMLVTANNLVQLFFGWEGVGLCSYLLIGFWSTRPSANAAAIKAFIVNRVGDFGFMLGIVGIFFVFDSVGFGEIFAAAPSHAGQSFVFLGMNLDVLTTLSILLFIGAMGKSAQIGLHTWLPDAMEGPTPVSALIHAATMVTAGVFMVARMSPLFEQAPVALAVVALVGGATAFFTATIALVQTDIKRVIAYSTCSQLGYMFFALGVSAYPAAIFHLMTHAFFKALLFLGVGSVIHAMSDEQDMRKMGGLWRRIPVTYVYMWIGSLALAGLPFFAGYFSKDIILEAAFGSGSMAGRIAFWLGIAAAFMTAFYSWRLIYLTFHGKPRAEPEVLAHVHESPPIMLVPLLVLAAGAVFAGVLAENSFVGEGLKEFWRGSLPLAAVESAIEAAHAVPEWVKLLPLFMGLGGILLATIFYLWTRGLPARLVAAFPGLYRLFVKKWYFDEIYDAVFVRGAFYIGRGFWKAGDGALIDGVGPDGLAAATLDLARRVGRLQTGYLYHYAFAILIGVAAFVSWYLFTGVA